MPHDILFQFKFFCFAFVVLPYILWNKLVIILIIVIEKSVTHIWQKGSLSKRGLLILRQDYF